ncbi:MAG: cytochrome c oxidase assembly protein [Acidimicrobiia bacterium]
MLPPWHPHYDVYALVFLLVYGYWYADHRLRPVMAPDAPRATRGQKWAWYLGVAFIWFVSGWPIHDIGETALFSVHMVEHMVIGLIVPPLLLLGTPRWLADRTLGHPQVARLLRPLARPVPAFVIFNTTFIVIHWPDLVDWMLTDPWAHFGVHTWLFFASILMWLPVLSPTPAIPRLSPPGQMLYLFFQSLLPTIPASFLTFSSAPLYSVYGDAAVAWGLTAVSDQTIAGVVMKLGGGFLIWGTIAVIWFRWTKQEREWEELEASLRAP